MAFTTRYNGLARLLFTDIYIMGIIDMTPPVSISSTNALKYSAIWGTGATNSVKEIDFVQEAQTLSFSTAGRNGPCQ